jgi:predicted ABC-type sugar transport system permease subunit
LFYKLAETIGNGKIFNIPYLILLWILLITIASFFLKNQMMESSLWGWI